MPISFSFFINDARVTDPIMIYLARAHDLSASLELTETAEIFEFFDLIFEASGP